MFETLKPLPANIQAFGHLDLDSRIVKGLSCHLDEPPDALRTVGRRVGYYRIAFPRDADERTFDVYFGLWVIRGRRLLPENGNADLRVPIGTVTRAPDGEPVLSP